VIIGTSIIMYIRLRIRHLKSDLFQLKDSFEIYNIHLHLRDNIFTAHFHISQQTVIFTRPFTYRLLILSFNFHLKRISPKSCLHSFLYRFGVLSCLPCIPIFVFYSPYCYSTQVCITKHKNSEVNRILYSLL
jgi:hypothetical protein